MLHPGGIAFIKVYMLSPELVESAGLGMMGVPGGPPPQEDLHNSQEMLRSMVLNWHLLGFAKVYHHLGPCSFQAFRGHKAFPFGGVILWIGLSIFG